MNIKILEANRISEKEYRIIFQNSPIGVAILDLNGNIINMNLKMEKIIGYALNELDGFNLDSFYPILANRQSLLDLLQEEGKIEDLEVELEKKNGTKYWIRLNANLTNLIREKVIVVSGEDITTERLLKNNLKRSKKILKGNEHILNSYFNAIQDGVSVLDRDLNIVRVNFWMEKMYPNNDSLIGKKCYEMYQKRTSVCPWCPTVRAFNSGEPETEIVPYPSEKNPTGWIELSAFPVKNEEGQVSNIIEYVKDVTELIEAMEKLKSSEMKLREAYNKAEFYQDLFTHDIKNILQTILMSIELNESILSESIKNDILTYNIALIKEQILRGSYLVSNILKFSQLDDTEFSTRKMDALYYLKNAISEIKNTPTTKEIDCEIKSSLKYAFIKSNELISDVFKNILFNAIKHNANDKVEVLIQVSKENVGNINYIQFEFKDNGRGIQDIRKKEIFQRGYKQSKIIHGLGLGLSFISSIISKYEGKMWVEDKIEGDYAKGSNFIILIPEG